jgi:hypothetical protein
MQNLLRLGYEKIPLLTSIIYWGDYLSTILKALQKDLRMDSDKQPLSGHSFRVGAALDLLEQGEPLEKIMLKGGWQTDSSAMKYLRNWAH